MNKSNSFPNLLKATLFLIAAFLGSVSYAFGDTEVVYREHLQSISENDLPLEIKTVRIHENELFMLMGKADQQPISLTEGWYLSLEQGVCSSGTLKVFNKDSNQSDRIKIKPNRDDGIFSRFVANCGFGGGYLVYRIRMLGERYFAFLTDEPGWTLFDRQTGKFLATSIRTRANAMSEIGVDAGQKIYVTYPAAKGNVYELGGNTGGYLEDSQPGISVKVFTLYKQDASVTFILPGFLAK